MSMIESPLHQIKSPMAAAKLGVALLKEEFSDSKMEREELEKILTEIDRKIDESLLALERYKSRLKEA